MTYSVSSYFVDESLKKTSTPLRRFTIGGSDYSSRVLKWPIVAKEWDRPKPVTVSIDLSNADQGMNFLRLDKTLITSHCEVDVGFLNPNLFLDEVDVTGIQSPIPEGSTISGLTFNDDGTKMYTAALTPDYVYEYDLSVPWDISTAVYNSVFEDLNVFTLTSITGIAFKPDGTKLYAMDVGTQSLWEFTLSTPWDINTAGSAVSYNIGTIGLTGLCWSSDGLNCYYSYRGTPDYIYQLKTATPWSVAGLSYTTGDRVDISASVTHATNPQISEDGLTLWVGNVATGGLGKGLYSLTMTTANDITTATLDSVYWDSFTDDSITPSYSLFCRTEPLEYYSQIFLYDLTGGLVETLHVHRKEYITVHAGTMDTIKYSKGKCNLRIIDKMKHLSDKLMGDRETPVAYTNELLSDIAWWSVTSYGGYDVTTSTDNIDIDWDQFMAWAAIMSGDNIRATTNFEGLKITEVLRKIARMSHSAIYIENDKLVFSRFGVADPPDINVTGDMVLDSIVSVKEHDIVNKQFVNAIYDTDSNFFQAVVFDVLTPSVNSFGIKEHVEEDTAIWYTTSASALNLAQRKTFTAGEPVDVVTVTTPLTTITKQLGDTIYFEDDQLDVAENYRIMRRSVDTERGKIGLIIDRSQLVSAFILDVTSLDGTEVLT